MWKLWGSVAPNGRTATSHCWERTKAWVCSARTNSLGMGGIIKAEWGRMKDEEEASDSSFCLHPSSFRSLAQEFAHGFQGFDVVGDDLDGGDDGHGEEGAGGAPEEPPKED